MAGAWNQPRPECKPIADALLAFLSQRGLTVMQFSEMIYGRDEKGTVKGVGNVYPTIHAAQVPSDQKIILWREKTGVDLTKVVEQVKETIGPRPPQKRVMKAPKEKPAKLALTPVRAAVAAHKKAVETGTASLVTPRAKPNYVPDQRPWPANNSSGPPLFAMSIAQDGTANLTLNLMNTTGEEALRCLNVLSAASLIKART